MKSTLRNIRSSAGNGIETELLENPSLEEKASGRPLTPQKQQVIYGPSGEILKEIYDEYHTRGYL